MPEKPASTETAQAPDLLGRVARLHYVHGLTHQQIADALGLSRVKVTRLLADARRAGIVEIRVHSDRTIFTDLELGLTDRFGLDQAWVAPTFEDRASLLNSIGIAGAECLQATLEPQMTVAVGLSETVGAMVPHIRADHLTQVTFVPAAGSRPSSNGAVNPHEVANGLARAFGARSRHLPAPVLARTLESATVLRAEPDVTEALRLARDADIGVFGVGGTQPGAGLLMDGTVPEDMIRQLIDAGAVGDMSGAFFDKSGTLVRSGFDQRVMAISLEDIAGIPIRIALAGGPGKVEALRGALAGGLITRLVTDQHTAQSLLGE